MKPEAQRIAVAEACGWKFAKIRKGSCGGDVCESVWFKPGFEPSEQTADWITHNGRIDPPDYLNDLNAMHEAEKVLRPVQWVSYWSFLEPIVCRPYNTSILHATATQRAEAFLRTLGLWEESE